MQAVFKSGRSALRRPTRVAGQVCRRQLATAPPKAARNWLPAAVVLTAGVSYAIGTASASAPAPVDHTKTYRPPTQEDFDAALAEVKKVLPEDCTSTDADVLFAHGTSDWQYHRPSALPGVVLYPRSTEDVSKIVKIAAKHHIPIVSFSGGTSLEGNTFAPEYIQKKIRLESEELYGKPKPGLAFSMDFAENMNQIVELHDGDLDVVVQPGMGYEVLNAELKSKKLFFPVDPGPGASASCNLGVPSAQATASNSDWRDAGNRYGTMRDNVLNMTIVLPDGEVIKTRQRAKKSSAGPDFGRYFIGSEGTLGIVTEATLKLAPLLPYSVGVTSFPTVEAAASCVRDLVQHGVNLQCIELLDDDLVRCVNKQSRAIAGARIWPEQPALFLKFQGSEQVMKLDVARTAELVKKNGGDQLQFARDDKEKDELWYGRKVALWSALDYYEGHRCIVTDVCVPISQFPTLVKEIKEDVEASRVAAPIVSHAADGNVHALLMFKTEEERERAMGVVKRMVERAQRLDGTCTGEHGVGIGKAKYLEGELGQGTVKVLRQIKQTLDPLNIMNPGKLLPDE